MSDAKRSRAATPKLAEKRIEPDRPRRGRSAIVARSFSATLSAAAGPVCGSRIANSSPPIRPRRSVFRISLLHIAALSIKTPSPAA